jgi:hypothetical protein
MSIAWGCVIEPMSENSQQNEHCTVLGGQNFYPPQETQQPKESQGTQTNQTFPPDVDCLTSKRNKVRSLDMYASRRSEHGKHTWKKALRKPYTSLCCGALMQ